MSSIKKTRKTFYECDTEIGQHSQVEYDKVKPLSGEYFDSL